MTQFHIDLAICSLLFLGISTVLWCVGVWVMEKVSTTNDEHECSDWLPESEHERR